MDEGNDAPAPTASSSTSTSRPAMPREQSSHTGKPKGILKNTANDNVTNNEGVRWDEVNLNLNEVEKEATTRMQILEPKTPYVRYDAETDTVMDLDKIPGFELGRTEQDDQPSTSTSQHQAVEGEREQEMHDGTSTSGTSDNGRTSSGGVNSSTNTPNHRAPSASSRSSSFSGSRRGSETSRRGSDVSERKMVVVEDLGPGADAEDEGADEETRQAKKAFKMRRGSHYSGEGEVMKRFKAGIIKLDDDEDDDNDSAIEIDDEDSEAGTTTTTRESVNGVNGGSTSSSTRQGRRIPPVPPLPNGTQ